MSMIEPSAASALTEKYSVAAAVIKDIEAIVADHGSMLSSGMDPTSFGIYFRGCAKAIELLSGHLSRVVERDCGQIVGPELYRWLGLATQYFLDGDSNNFTTQLVNLPSYLLGRLLVLERVEQGVTLLLSANDLNGAIAIPQSSAELPLLPPSRTPLTAHLDDHHLVLDHPKRPVFLRSDLRQTIDGRFNSEIRFVRGTETYFHSRGAELLSYVNHLSDIASEPIAAAQNLRVLDASWFADDTPRRDSIVQALDRGAHLLQKTAPNLSDEVFSIMDAICLVDGGRYVGSSDIFYHGVAFFNPDRSWTDVTFADHLVHEGAHIRLHALNELTPILRNPHEMGAPSPIRIDPRPIYGVFHSTFVFLRLVQFFDRLRQVQPSNEEVVYRFNRHLKGFYEGMASVEKYADLTADGETLFGAMRVYHSTCRDRGYAPDLELASKINPDYVV